MILWGMLMTLWIAFLRATVQLAYQMHMQYGRMVLMEVSHMRPVTPSNHKEMMSAENVVCSTDGGTLSGGICTAAQ